MALDPDGVAGDRTPRASVSRSRGPEPFVVQMGMMVFESVTVAFPNGSGVTLPIWVIALAGMALCSAIGALAVWGIIRGLNRRAKRPPGFP